MVYSTLNHIQGKIGSRWAQFVRETGVENILIVAIDAAKYTPKAMIATFYGEILEKPFDIDASMSGFTKLKTLIGRHKVKANTRVVVGIETTGHYYEHLVFKCHLEGYHVRTINAATTAKEREALLNWSKTDNLDLMAIVQSVIHGRGTSNELPTGNIAKLRKLTRARRELTSERTKTKNLIRMHMDHIFREYQGKTVWINGKRKISKPLTDVFGKASRYLMRHYPHPSDILKLGEEGLRDLSIRENLKLRDKSIQLLLEYAEGSISRPKEQLDADIFLLSQKLDRLDLLDDQIKVLERKIEELFIVMDGAVVLSVQGIGLVTGAELVAEIGDLSDFDEAGQLIKLAGTNPIVKQSGDNRPSYYGVSKQGRRPFRNIVYQVGRSLAVNNPEMQQRYQKLKERGKHSRQAYIALGNRMIRLAFAMIRNHTLYQTEDKNYVLLEEISKKIRKTNVKKFFETHVSPIKCAS
ncbi:IS110 family transposase [Sutcliffiella cohnii]|uniref:IS110 family transposase n=2 Tax=Sutcliffiella cohnii TaxID=33932 RepID=A0A223KW86_9BACI|nr:IS110 family transposase [Sutcliffiella cohnii]AST93526.1 IS110 family transposase [Sutcliffiella cohnii]AST93530.1 IS110 family transposase [Sutcliffiella cohnii]AST93657.1 IS110 family transposase [Sutcliffiella cohnii]